MKPAILDTDILSQFFRGNPVVIQYAEEYIRTFSSLQFSIITYYEILNGLLYKDARKQINVFLNFVEFNKVFPLTLLAAQLAAEIYADLRRTGKIIGHTDSLIAGIALSNNLQLVTNNTEHFSRVKGLEIVNWMS